MDLGRCEWGWGVWPHLSLAYFHGAEDTKAIEDSIRPHMDAVGATLEVNPDADADALAPRPSRR